MNVGNPATFSVGATQTISALNTVGFQGTGRTTIGSGAALTVGNSTDNLNSTVNGVISGAGSLVKSGSGTMTLTGVNTYQNGTVINNGILAVGPTLVSNTTTPLSTGSVQLNGGTLALQGQNVSFAMSGLTSNYYLGGTNGAPNPVNDGGNPGTGNGWSLVASQSVIASTFGPLTPFMTVNSTTNIGATPLPTFYFGGNDNSSKNNFITSANGGGNVGTAGNNLNNGVNFTVISTGNINITTSGTYTFATTSDDGSMLFINTGTVATPNWVTVANNNYSQGTTQRGGTIALNAGSYPIEIAYYEGGGGYIMSAQGELGTFTNNNIPNSNDNNNVNSTQPSPFDLPFSDDPTVNLGLYNGSNVVSATQTYTNNVSVTSDSTINVTTSLAAVMGNLTIGGHTLNVNSSDTSGSMYTLTMGATTLTGNPTFNVTNSTGNGQGVFVLGALNDGGTARTITVSGSGAVRAHGPGIEPWHGNGRQRHGQSVPGRSGALGTTATVNVNGGGTLALGEIRRSAP